MGPNHHEEFVRLPGLGHAFITGVPDKCEHDYSDVAFTLANGDILMEKDYRCPTDEETQKYVEKVAKDRNTYINGGTTVCTKCKKVFFPDLSL